MFCWVNVVVVVVVDSSNEEWTVNSELPLTDSGKTIDPTRDGISGESQTSGVAEMVAILSDEIVSISSVFGGEFFHNRLHLAGSHVGFPIRIVFLKVKPSHLFGSPSNIPVDGYSCAPNANSTPWTVPEQRNMKNSIFVRIKGKESDPETFFGCGS